MKRKIIYRSVDVQQVRVAELLPLLVAGCIVAMDVAKEKFVVALATLAGEVVKLVRFQHPTQTRAFLAVVEELRAALGADKVVAAMEPTGTYGDAVRLQLVRAGVPVHMVSPKRTHDSKELFDGVPSLHDPKSAVLVAKLESMQLSTPWSEPPATRVRLRALVDARQHQRAQEEMSFGRLEAALARHWPEHGQWMDVREQMSALRLLVEYPSPARVAKEPEKARSLLRSASRGRLSVQAIEGVITGAKETLGVPMVAEEEQLVSMLATSLISARQCAESLERQMLEVAKDDEVFLRLARWMGTYTAAVIVTHVDPRQYSHAPQLEKACGMNLREKSSGESNGRLSLTYPFRGPHRDPGRLLGDPPRACDPDSMPLHPHAAAPRRSGPDSYPISGRAASPPRTSPPRAASLSPDSAGGGGTSAARRAPAPRPTTCASSLSSSSPVRRRSLLLPRRCRHRRHRPGSSARPAVMSCVSIAPPRRPSSSWRSPPSCGAEVRGDPPARHHLRRHRAHRPALLLRPARRHRPRAARRRPAR